MPVTYEFVIETLDFYEGCGDDPDIIDTCAFDTLGGALAYADRCDESIRFCLRRDEGNDLDGLIARGHAYPDRHGKLPERFETATGLQDEAPVPKRFREMTFPVYPRKDV